MIQEQSNSELIVTSHPLHGMSPYIGRLATHRANELINRLSKKGETVVDPFCGSGTIPLEAWKSGKKVVASDLSPYAIALTRAKLFPISTLEQALKQIELLDMLVKKETSLVDLRRVPVWVRSFYHPETLREAIAWSNVLKKRKNWFLFGCFLNLLHHQRPGFLSYPSSHAIPYLRRAKFPRKQFPELYEFRDVKGRLLKKVCRTLKNPVAFNFELSREVKLCNATNLIQTTQEVDCIITSPPYMSRLHYARDNRLRLWFCGVPDWTELESQLSPTKSAFSILMNNCVSRWQYWLRQNGHLAIVLGDIHRDNKRIDVAKLVLESVKNKAPLLELVSCEDQVIPDEKRLIKANAGTLTETTLIFRRTKKC